MSTLANHSKREKLTGAALSLKAVRKYQRDRRNHGAERVRLYFDDVEGDWLNQLNNDNSIAAEEHKLSSALGSVMD